MVTTLIFIGFIAMLIFSMTSLFVRRSNREYFDDVYNSRQIMQYPQHRYYSERESSFSWISTIVSIAGLLIAIFVLFKGFDDSISSPNDDSDTKKIEMINVTSQGLKSDLNYLNKELISKLDTIEYRTLKHRLDSIQFRINELEKITK